MDRLRCFSLVLACLIYGAFGSPTPQGTGWAEILVGMFLVLSVHPAAVMDGLKGVMLSSCHRVAGLFLIYGVGVMMPAGLMAGNSPSLIVRDMIPFLFMLLPFFVRAGSAAQRNVITYAVAVIGVLFSLRLIGPFSAGDDPLYLSIAPTVLFAALLLAGVAGLVLYRRVGWRSLLMALACLAGSGVCVMAMVLTMQRASLGLFVAGLVVLAAMAAAARPARALAPLAVLGCVAILVLPAILSVAEGLAFKQSMVGLNMRWQEAEVVLNAIHHAGVLPTVFGFGWGATVESPAVGGMSVNFTHNLFTTMLLKGGWIAVFLMGVMLYRLCWPGLLRMRQVPVVMVALFAPIAIDSTLYASFKSLDFGLILLLMMLWTRPGYPEGRPVDKMRDSTGDEARAGCCAVSPHGVSLKPDPD